MWWKMDFSRLRRFVDEAPLKVTVYAAGAGSICFVVNHRDPDAAFAADLRTLLRLNENWRFYVGSAAPDPTEYRAGPGQGMTDSVEAFVSALWRSYPREDNAENSFSAASTGRPGQEDAAVTYFEVAEALAADTETQGVLFDRSIVDVLGSWFFCSSTHASEVAHAIETSLGQCTYVDEACL